MPMNILHLHDGSGFYGAEAVILNLCKALENTDYHAIVGSLMDGVQSSPDLGRHAESIGLETAYFPMRMKLDLRVFPRIGQVVRQRNIRLIHAHGYKSNAVGLIAAKAFRVPMVTTNHLFPLLPKGDKKLQFYSAIDAAISMKHLDRIVAVSEEIRDKLVVKGLRRSIISVIENGIDLDAYRGQEAMDTRAYRRSLGLGERSFVVGTIGRLTEQKGQVYFLEAAQTLLRSGIPVEFLVAGDGPLRNGLLQQAEQMGIAGQVRFLGYRTDTAELLKLMDLFVLSSIDEGLPMVMLEAMASRTPVVVTSVGHIPHVIRDHENGLLVEPGNSALLADRIRTLLGNQTLKDLLAENAARTVEQHHSKEAMCGKYLSVYDECLRHTATAAYAMAN
jgi:glycosyltransferase involved in cell wall biosynthesis